MSVSRTGLHSGGERPEVGVRSPHGSNCLDQRRNTSGRVKQLICGSLSGMRMRQSFPQPFTPQRGTQVL